MPMGQPGEATCASRGGAICPSASHLPCHRRLILRRAAQLMVASRVRAGFAHRGLQDWAGWGPTPVDALNHRRRRSLWGGNGE